jgi:hypothetical protein
MQTESNAYFFDLEDFSSVAGASLSLSPIPILMQTAKVGGRYICLFFS